MKKHHSYLFFARYFFWLLTSSFFLSSCKLPVPDYNQGYSDGYHAGYAAAEKTYAKQDSIKIPESNIPATSKNNFKEVPAAKIPPKVYQVLQFVRSEKHAPDGYVGGRVFGNYEGHLPDRDESGKTITYQEWDVNPKEDGKNRGTQRLITGSDGRAWYTEDHYNSFVEVISNK